MNRCAPQRQLLDRCQSRQDLLSSFPNLILLRLHVGNIRTVDAAGGICLPGHLVQVVGGVPEKRDHLVDIGRVQLDDIAVKLDKIGRAHV